MEGKRKRRKLTKLFDKTFLYTVGSTTLDERIKSGLSFLKSLESDHPGKYWEVIDPKHSDHKIWPQSLFLLQVAFKRLGEIEISRKIKDANDFTVLTIDRPNLRSNGRFCVLDDNIGPFYLPFAKTSDCFDEVALIGHNLALRKDRTATKLAEMLRDNWNSRLGVLGMDKADKKDALYRVYKTALAGTLFARLGMINECQNVASTLLRLQENEGGWKTDLDTQGNKAGLPNIETTCLALICLDCVRKGRF